MTKKKKFGDQMTSFLFEHDQMTKVRTLNLHCQTASSCYVPGRSG